MIKRIQLEAVEDKQLPRWVYAMMKANQDPNAEDEIADNPRMRTAARLKAEELYKKRKQRLKELDQQSGGDKTSRTSGLEWKFRPANKFTKEEMQKVMPTGIAYNANRTIFFTIVASGVLLATGTTFFIGMAFCAELKMGGNFPAAWQMLVNEPGAYVHRVIAAFDW